MIRIDEIKVPDRQLGHALAETQERCSEAFSALEDAIILLDRYTKDVQIVKDVVFLSNALVDIQDACDRVRSDSGYLSEMIGGEVGFPEGGYYGEE